MSAAWGDRLKAELAALPKKSPEPFTFDWKQVQASPDPRSLSGNASLLRQTICRHLVVSVPRILDVLQRIRLRFRNLGLHLPTARCASQRWITRTDSDFPSMNQRRAIRRVIADTHGLFDPAIRRHFKSIIIHAGDIGNQSVIEQLEQIAPATAVSGNVDNEGQRIIRGLDRTGRPPHRHPSYSV